MKSVCAACRRAAANSTSGRTLCASCSWRDARNHSSTPAEHDAGSSEVFASTKDEDALLRESDVAMLFDLAPLVGETGADVVSRVMLGIAKGNGRAYRAEVNRLTAKYIAALERQCSACS